MTSPWAKQFPEPPVVLSACTDFVLVDYVPPGQSDVDLRLRAIIREGMRRAARNRGQGGQTDP